MADPLTIAASVVGITVPALHGTKLLLDDLEKLKYAPKLYSSVHNSHIAEEIKKTISTKQAEVKCAIATADKQPIVLEYKMEDMDHL
ncbi:uncharacterized protein Z518_04635 [Rhinocladiella mackenziei CBS 650.93]|uniref:Uncharacterized protein n=1 Tax=Rhinocladiella mackenziei CBS 650.93 TaxID=1442369 RepID=A0A0D2ILM9_9EURO|nr:uncharacterized protein Z518_04635 [Rhinocladiella mackenziei CBS 650.93]KIX06659.1 hypothetical protein Z518_04635 [Rhinocladiella mackenziei CBS 650.93]